MASLNVLEGLEDTPDQHERGNDTYMELES